MNRRTGKTNVIVLLISLFCLHSCGLEEFLYVDYVPDGTITDNTSATVWLPSSSAEGYANYFSNFVIYYRIYISGEGFSGEINTSIQRNQLNSSLNSDFSGLYNLTEKTSTSANPSNLETTFTNRRYFKITLVTADTLEEVRIENVLGRNSLGKRLDIQFSPVSGERPVLILNGVPYILRRAVSGPSVEFRPRPEDRFFLNHPDLYDSAYVTNEINADAVAPNSNTQHDPRYSYVSMYIFAIGKDYISTIYSQPTHLGIFRLPEAF